MRKHILAPPFKTFYPKEQTDMLALFFSEMFSSKTTEMYADKSTDRVLKLYDLLGLTVSN